MKRQQWIAMLAKLTAPMDSTTAAQAFVAYLPMLARLPDEVFCQASLEAVASQCGHTPTYGTVRTALDAWWKQRRPAIAELPAPLPPMRAPPDDAERACVSRTVGEIIAGCHKVSERKDALVTGRSAQRVAPLLSRETLNELYRRAGVAGPQVPARSPAADVIPIRAGSAGPRTP